jgi:hypothetical protein
MKKNETERIEKDDQKDPIRMKSVTKVMEKRPKQDQAKVKRMSRGK